MAFARRRPYCTVLQGRGGERPAGTRAALDRFAEPV
jgi:hypothetical protein